jgi:hypothetical protein
MPKQTVRKRLCKRKAKNSDDEGNKRGTHQEKEVPGKFEDAESVVMISLLFLY